MSLLTLCSCHPLTGTPAVASRNMGEAEMRKIVDFMDEGVVISQDVNKKTGNKNWVHVNSREKL